MVTLPAGLRVLVPLHFAVHRVIHAQRQRRQGDLVDGRGHAVEVKGLACGQADRGILEIQVELERPVALGEQDAVHLIIIYAQVFELRAHGVPAHLTVADLTRFDVLDGVIRGVGIEKVRAAVRAAQIAGQGAVGFLKRQRQHTVAHRVGQIDVKRRAVVLNN